MNLAVLIPFTLLVGIVLYFLLFRKKAAVAVVPPTNAPASPAPHEVGVERDAAQNARLQAIIHDANSFDRLVELSSSLYYPDYYIGFANHLPMTLIALKDFLERDTTSIQKDFLWLRDYFSNYEHRLTPLFFNREKLEQTETITDLNWKQFLGKKIYYKAYFKYFSDSLDRFDILGLIDELAPGAATSKAFHPVIQLAYAMWYGNGKAFRPNLNMKRFTDGIRTMIISAFAFWAAYFQAPGVQLDATNEVDVAPQPNCEQEVNRFVTLLNQASSNINIQVFAKEVLFNFKEEFLQMMKTNEKEIKQGLIDSQLVRLYNAISKSYPGMLEALSAKLDEQLPNDDEGLNQVIRNMHEFSQLMLMPNTQNILTLHCVTGSHALHIIWDTLYLSFASSAKQKKFIKSWYLSLMLVYIHQQFPEFPTPHHDITEVPENKWESLEKMLLHTDIKKLDEHDIKLLFTCHSMSKYYQRQKEGDEIQAHYFTIAADRLHATSFA